MRRIFEAQPEEEGGEEGNEPTVTVLLIRRPLEAEVATENEPKECERAEEEQSREQGAGSRE